MDTIRQLEEMKERLSIPPNVLIVEDDQEDAHLLSALIPEGKARAWVAPSAEAARRTLEAIKFDVIFLDIKLVGESGIALLKWLKTQNIHTPVAVVTGLPLDQVNQAEILPDVLMILTKPVSQDSLDKIMRQLKLWT